MPIPSQTLEYIAVIQGDRMGMVRTHSCAIVGAKVFFLCTFVMFDLKILPGHIQYHLY